MSYTEESLCNAVYEEMRRRGLAVEPSIIPRLRTQIRPALERVSIAVAESPSKQIRNLLRRTFADSIAVVSGTADLSTLLSDARPLLLRAVRTAEIRGSSGLKIQVLADRSSLEQTRPTAFKFGAVENATLYTNAADGSYTVAANFVETDVAQLKRELEPMLFDELIGAKAE